MQALNTQDSVECPTENLTQKNNNNQAKGWLASSQCYSDVLNKYMLEQVTDTKATLTTLKRLSTATYKPANGESHGPLTDCEEVCLLFLKELVVTVNGIRRDHMTVT